MMEACYSSSKCDGKNFVFFYGSKPDESLTDKRDFLGVRMLPYFADYFDITKIEKDNYVNNNEQNKDKSYKKERINIMIKDKRKSWHINSRSHRSSKCVNWCYVCRCGLANRGVCKGYI